MSRRNPPQNEQVKPVEQPPAETPAAPAEIQKTTPIEEAIEQDKATPTTMKVKPDTKARLEELKGIFKVPDLDAVVGRLIDTLPKRLSTETEVHLVMSKSKYTWLMAKQDTCDCRTCLNDSRV